MDLEPLARWRYSLEVRTADLRRRMITAKVHRADAVFLADPFDADRALLTAKETPTELFLAWHTAALLLARADDLGSIPLPGGSHNHVFARGHDAVLVAWNERPTEEVLYLGQQIRQFDMWGRPGAPAGRAGASAQPDATAGLCDRP